VKSARLRKPKAAWLLSYVDYRPDTNMATLKKQVMLIGGFI
jgi:hypothetical protein